MNLTISPIKTPAFQGRQEYKAIRNIPNIPCACCGQKVILPSAFAKLFQQVAKPLQMMLDKGFLDAWSKNAKVMELLKRWAAEEPKLSLDVITEKHPDKYAQLRTAVTETVKGFPQAEGMMENEVGRNISHLFNDIFSRSRSKLKGSAVVMKHMAKFKESLQGSKLETFEQLEIYARKYPRKSLNEILDIKEIYEFHTMKDLLQRAEMREKLNYHYDNIENILKKTKAFTEDEINELKQNADNLYSTERDSEARVQLTKDMYENALKSKNLEKLKFKIFDELSQVPKTFMTKDSFLAFAHNRHYSDAKIIESLLVPSMSSFEHIIPRSMGGADQAKNGIILCADCNEKRKTRPYSEFLKYHPQMPFNTNKQINFVADMILKEKLGGPFRYWPVQVSETLNEYTDGKIKPDVTKYCQKEYKKSAQRLEANQERYLNLKDKQSSEVMKKIKLQDEIKQVDKELEKVSSGIEKTRNVKKNESMLSLFLNDYIKKTEK